MTARIDVITELNRARKKFPKFNSAHEGYAILLEEVEELKREVFWGPTHSIDDVADLMPKAERRRIRMRAEAVQVAAMALRFIEDVCDE
jgi:hypothetical protein